MNNESILKFYQTEAVHNILKRYKFTEKEKKIIHAAILSAKRDNPNMKLIKDADDVLNEVSQRNPQGHTPKVEEKDLAKAIAGVNIKNYKKPQSAWTTPIETSSSTPIYYILLPGILVAIILIYMMNSNDERYSFEEAQKICQEKGEVLPLTIDDFINSEYKFLRPSLFWLADGKVIFTQTWEKDFAAIEGKNHFICVQENGHKGEYEDIYSGIR